MDIAKISTTLTTNHARFAEMLRSLSDTEFVQEKPPKWTAAQQLEHIVRAVQPVALAFRLPKFLLRLLFGKANRPSRTFEGLVEKYRQKLAAGGRASGRFVPPKTGLGDREKLLADLEKQVGKLTRRLGGFSETELDTLILPHPLLGKLTLREMLFFTAYHVTHHERAVREMLKKQL